MKRYKVSKAVINKWKLDEEEIEILEAIENGDIKPIPISEEKRKLMIEAAKNTIARLKKEKSITLRMNEEILSKLKVIAQKEGMPYQTLIGSILHKYATSYHL